MTLILRLTSTASAAAMLLAAAPAFALDQRAPDADVAGQEGANAIDQVVVTANRSAQPIERVGASVTVLDQTDIADRQAVVVAELLESTPAVHFTRNGGPGTTTTVNIRGAEGQHTVALIDGVKLNDPSSPQGGFDFGNLLIGDVSRIEVLRGSQSTLWGSQAIGGVVNIVTRDPVKPFEADLDTEGGSRGTAYVRAGAGGHSDRLTWRLAGGYYTTDGFSAYRYGTEPDGYHNSGVSGRVRFALTDDVSIEARSVYSKGRTDIDGFNVDSPETSSAKQLVTYVGLNAALFDGRFKNRAAFTYTDTDRVNLDPDTPTVPVTFDAVGQNRRWEYQGTFAFTETWTAVFGAESERSRMHSRSPSTFDPNPAVTHGRASTDSVYGQIQGEVLPGLTLTGGLRYDHHDTVGGKTLGQAAAAWVVNNGSTILRASFGQGFRAPGLYELFSEFGNTALKPESFNSWDAGVEQRWLEGRVTASATYFHRDADNEIRFNSCFGVTGDPLCSPGGGTRFGYYLNLQKTEAQGVELEATAKVVEHLTLTANYTWTDARDRSGPNNGRFLSRRPENMGTVSATYLWPAGLSTGVAMHYVGRTFNDEANRTRVGGYVLTDLRASYPINERLEIYGRVENLFDKSYQTILNYGTPGRSGFVGLRARF